MGHTPRRTRLAGYERESQRRYIPASDNDNRVRYRYAIFARRTIILVCTPTSPRALYS